MKCELFALSRHGLHSGPTHLPFCFLQQTQAPSFQHSCSEDCFHNIQLKHLSASGGFFPQCEQLQKDVLSVCRVPSDRHLAGGKAESIRRGVTKSLRDEPWMILLW